jgi:hypothetical protein
MRFQLRHLSQLLTACPTLIARAKLSRDSRDRALPGLAAIAAAASVLAGFV